MFWGLIPTFRKVTGKKLVGRGLGTFSAILSRVKRVRAPHFFTWPRLRMLNCSLSPSPSSTAKWTEAVAQRCSVKKVFLEVSQNSQKNTCARVSFLKKKVCQRCFPVNFVKFLKAPFFKEHHWLLPLNENSCNCLMLRNGVLNFERIYICQMLW